MDALDAELREAMVGQGGVVIRTTDVTDMRTFKHRPLPIDDHLDVLSELLDSEAVWAVRGRAWRTLVRRHLIPRLGHQVQLQELAHNPAWAQYVDGLTNNEERLAEIHVDVTAEEVADACLEAMKAPNGPAELQEQTSERPKEGVGSMLGRQVEVFLHGEHESLVGQMTAFDGDTLSIVSTDADHPELVVLPLRSVLYLKSWQLRPEEACRYA